LILATRGPFFDYTRLTLDSTHHSTHPAYTPQAFTPHLDDLTKRRAAS
jgi:hypothetical protein